MITRMLESFGLQSILLRWTMALIVFGLFSLDWHLVGPAYLDAPWVSAANFSPSTPPVKQTSMIAGDAAVYELETKPIAEIFRVSR